MRHRSSRVVDGRVQKAYHASIDISYQLVLSDSLQPLDIS